MLRALTLLLLASTALLSWTGCSATGLEPSQSHPKSDWGLNPAADLDGDGVPTGDDPAPFASSLCGDANHDGVDDCAASACIKLRLGDYNLFLLENYSLGTDVEGKVAAGGDISMDHFSVGHRLADSQIAQTLVAGGNLTLSNGGVWGDAAYGGNYTSDTSVTFVRGAPAQGTPIDFASRGGELRTLSSRLDALAVNGTATFEAWGGIMLHGSAPDVNVFQVPASAFSGAKVLSIDAPAGSLAILNVHGLSATFTGFGQSFSGGIDQHGVLFNFVDATDITAQGYGFWGTVLAPSAHVSFSDGSFDGGIYARSLTGNAEGHLNPLQDRDICQDASACLRGPSLTEADSGSSVALGDDELLTVTLEAMNSAGYQWTVSGIDPGVLKLAGSEHVGGSVPGSLDRQFLRFSGVSKGTSALTVSYRRPWESTTPPSRTFKLNVVVQGQYTGCYREPVAPARAIQSSPPRTTALPSAYTYCDSSTCTPVKDQGQCGSCWAFATVGVMEQLEKQVDGVERDLSEQHLVSCTTDRSRFLGCRGGWEAFDYYDTLNDQMNAVGTVYEHDFPYVAADVACRMGITHHERIASWEELANSETDTLKQAIADHGPIWATVCADPAFQNYQAGTVFNGTNKCHNHAVVITGWDDRTQSWLVRNSWGQTWGDHGYMRIAYGANDIGQIASAATYTSSPSNDFSILVGPSSQSVPAGSSVSYTVVTATTSGSDENISLAVSGLPAGVTGTLSPPSVSSGDLSVLTITVAPCTAPATFTFSVVGVGSSATHSASANLTIQENCGGGGDRQLPLSINAVSGACSSAPPSSAVDGDPSTAWNACAWPTQFIEVDLGGVAQISKIRLLTAQLPAGLTSHRLWGRDSYGNWLVYYGDITGYTTDNQWLELTPLWSPPVRYLFIETSQGPSWVAWREIEVYGTY